MRCKVALLDFAMAVYTDLHAAPGDLISDGLTGGASESGGAEGICWFSERSDVFSTTQDPQYGHHLDPFSHYTGSSVTLKPPPSALLRPSPSFVRTPL